jgi:hypothetical protein
VGLKPEAVSSPRWYVAGGLRRRRKLITTQIAEELLRRKGLFLKSITYAFCGMRGIYQRNFKLIYLAGGIKFVDFSRFLQI